MIELKNISYAIHGQSILKDITTDIPAGKVTALVGPNGAGKSTLLSLVSRLNRLQSGSVKVGGLDVTSTPSMELARRLAILTQSNSVTSRLSVRDLVSFGRFPHHRGRPEKRDFELVDEAVNLMGLEPLADRFLDELSGGQRQKAFVAMAYAQDTDYLLLDEPLNNLDMASARALMTTLGERCRADGKTIVVVLHEINYAASHADWIVGLREGELVTSGATDEILTSENIERIFGVNAEIHQLGDQKLVAHFG